MRLAGARVSFVILNNNFRTGRPVLMQAAPAPSLSLLAQCLVTIGRERR